MNYQVIDIEGIGEVYADKLARACITTTDQLLEACRTPAMRRHLAATTDISPTLILKWANHADLMRVDGIGPQTAELLEEAGVDTAREFVNRNPVNLHSQLVDVNISRHLTGRVPSAKELERMISNARALEPALTY